MLNSSFRITNIFLFKFSTTTGISEILHGYSWHLIMDIWVANYPVKSYDITFVS